MFFDYNQPSVLGDFITFPDWPFTAEPRLIIEENPSIGGESSTNSNIGGSVDNT